MMRRNILIGVLITAILFISVTCIAEKSHNIEIEKNIDQCYLTCYNALVLNMLNMTVEGIGEAAMDRYNIENTKYGYMLSTKHSISSYAKNNSDLNEIIMWLDQVTGYDAVYSVNMSKQLYDKLKLVPNNNFGDSKIIAEAKKALENSIVK